MPEDNTQLKLQPTLDEIVSLSKRRGFVYPTSAIYGGLANSYDYGPLGTELLRNIKNLWWNEFITKRSDMVGLDSQILLHPKTWEASGHVGSFSDPLVDDVVTKKRYRADHLIEEWIENQTKQGSDKWTSFSVETLSIEEMSGFIKDNNILSPEGNQVTEPKAFNLLFETEIGTISGDKAKVYLRGETAQGIFSNFSQVLDSTRVQLPFGIGQVGKSFRNEITTGQFIFRTLELEQAEIEYFFNPNKQDWQELLETWKQEMMSFVTTVLGVKAENLRWRRHTDTERSFYSKDTYDLDYNFSFGWKELWGVAYRTDYDLKQHMKFSGQSLEYRDPYTGEVFVPHVMEPALGIGRSLLMVLTDAYYKDEEKNRIVLKLKPSLAPYKTAIFPLVKNKPEIVELAQGLFKSLSQKFSTTWDSRGNIGKRYLYQDEIGTPFCITVDYETLENQTVTIRDRDTTNQTRISISELEKYIESMLK
ncbi:glycine--tRNA ligase [Candidatus Woesebacteria bacterium]|nr:glycine--tRNA ligase [Candidatus Woesebacteria bacterium]